MAQRKLPFRKWVPNWLIPIVAFVVMIPILMINGAYSGSSIDIAGYLGVLSEDITMASYASSAGMAVAYPLITKIRPVVTTKTVLVSGLLIQVFFSLICAQTNHIEIIAICSFFIGFFKAFAMLEIMFMFMSISGKGNDRSLFYSFFYPILLSFGQLSMILTAEMAYLYKWQHMYYLMIGLLLLSIVLVLICFRFGRRPIRIPIKDADWISVSFASVFLLSIIYVSTYGKVNDWFSSGRILFMTILIPVSFVLFIRRQLLSETPYVDLSVLGNRDTQVGYFFMFVMMFFSASSSVISSYTNSVLRLDSVHANMLYIWMIPGFIVAGILCYWWFKNHKSFKYLVFIGFSCFAISTALLYFEVHPAGLYELLFVPMILRGVGMLILFVAFGVYVIQGLPQTKMISNAFFLIGIRSVIAPAVCASIFANWLYQLQQKNMVILSENMDLQNPLFVSRYTSTLNTALGQGISPYNAQQLAINNIYNSLQIQSLMLTIKMILGYTLIISLIVLVLIILLPFIRKKRRERIVSKMGIDMV